MSLVVLKFGGTSVANDKLLKNVADIIANTYKKGNDVIVVVSAQGSTTDMLINKANDINPDASKREMDVLMSAGEQMSSALLAMAIEKLNLPVVSLLGWQAGVMTSSEYGGAYIKRIDPGRISKELDKKNIVIVAGFQGLSRYYDVTTLGRGGSDTTAVGIASALNAEVCKIYTDVDGVYTADPRIVPKAKKLDCISYDEMLELAGLGAQVLNKSSVEIAKKHNVKVEVISSTSQTVGTIVKDGKGVEKMIISGVAKDDNVARISIAGVPSVKGIEFKVFSNLYFNKINVDVILQSRGKDGVKDITITVEEDQLGDALLAIKDFFEDENEVEITYDNNISKVSIVGAGVQENPGVASKMFEALYTVGIDIQTISTSEINISVLVRQDESEEAVKAIHDAFFSDAVPV